MAQKAKNLPAMWEAWVPSLGWEDPLENGMAAHFSILAWRSMNCIVHWIAKSQTGLSDFQFHFKLLDITREHVSVILSTSKIGPCSGTVHKY